MSCARPPLRDYGRPPHAREEPVVCEGHEPCPIDERLHLRRHIGEIDWRTQYDPVSRGHLLDVFVDYIVVEDAPPVSVFKAFHARCAAADRFAGKLNQFGLNAFVFEFLEHVSN